MRRLLSPLLLTLPLFILFSVYYYQNKHTASAALADHVVISEIQVAGTLTNNDFVELYNPTSSAVDLSDYRLVKVTSTGADDSSIVAFEVGDIIPAHGYFLWCNTTLSAILDCDRSTSAIVSDNNSIGLRNGSLNTGTLVDSVTFGTPANPLGEGTFLTTPLASSSVERKANSLSNVTSMGTGGTDELAGNGEDTDNNSVDFVTRITPQPQNSESTIEPAITPTPTPEVTPTPSPTIEPTPTIETTPTPTPTIDPTSTPTLEPTATPTVSPSPFPTPIPTITPSPSPTTSPFPRLIARGLNFACFMGKSSVRIMGIEFKFPTVRCISL